MLSSLIALVLVSAVLATLPIWKHSRAWGYLPSGGLGVVTVIVIVLLITGRI